MKTFVSGLMIAATLAGGMLATSGPADAQDYRMPYYRHGGGHGGHGGYGGHGGHYYRGGGGGGDAAAAAALGLVGGMILGGALAQSSRADDGYDEYVERPVPRRVYEGEYRRSYRGARCDTLIKYDMYGKPYEYKDCNP